MLSRFSMRWRWYDWVWVAVAPTSGLSASLHQGFHALALGVGWIASGLSDLAQLLGQL
jgi:hypothetical protein